MWRISFGCVSISFLFSFVTSVSSYQFIAFWIAFGDNFVWIIICRIVYFWLKRQFIKSFYHLCQTVRRNSPLICNVCFLSWCIGRDGGLNESVGSHVIGISFFLLLFCHDRKDYLLKLLFFQWFLCTEIMLNNSLQQISIVLFFLGGHSRLLIYHIKSVQNILTTFKYVKIAQHFICNQIFLILCLILCMFLFVNIFKNAFRLVLLRRKCFNDDAFWFVLVRKTDLW